MADRDPHISGDQGSAHQVHHAHGVQRPWLRPVLMISVPLLLLAAGGVYYLAR